MSDTRVTVPEIGEAIEEGTLLQWLIEPGGHVAVGQPLFELSTDKVDSEIPSPVAGILAEVLVSAGSPIRVGDEVAIISASSGSADEPSSAGEPKVPLREEAAVVEETPTVPPRQTSSSLRTSAPLPPLPGQHAARLGGTEHVDDNIEEFSRIRAVTAKVMAVSSATVPHVLSVVEVDYSSITRARDRRRRKGRPPTSLAFITSAVATALQEFPRLNSSVADGGLRFNEAISIAIAVDTPDGLMAPVIRNADRLSVDGLAQAIRDLAIRARQGDLVPGDLSGATFTISNNGSAGSVLTAALITPPQVAVLSTDLVVDRPVVVDADGVKGIGIRPMGNLSLGWDHRAVDGAEAATFLVRIKELSESQWNESA